MHALTLRRSAAPSPSYSVDAIPSGYDEATRIQMLAMPGVVWVVDRSVPNGRGHFRGPAEAINVAATTLEAAGVVTVTHDGDWRAQQRHDSDLGANCVPELRDYQRAGMSWIKWMLRHTGAALLSDDMGIGKTAQAIAAVDDIPGRVLVVCPAIVVPHWQSQITRWGTRFGTEAVDALPDDAPKMLKGALESWRSTNARWHVLSYDMWLKRRHTLPDFAVVILDEIHYASNGKAKRSEALREYLEPTDLLTTGRSRPFVLGLSGTPMTTRPKDLWHVLELLWPNRFGGFWQFTKRYCDGRYVEIPGLDRSVWVCEEKEGLCKGRSHEAELGVRLSHVMLRRTKAQVALELPARSRVMIDVDVTVRDPYQFPTPAGDSANGIVVQDMLAMAEAMKLDAAEALARECLANGGRPLLLTLRRASAEELGRRLLCPAVTGDVPVAERRALLVGPEDADSAGVATLASVTTGIDLTEFDSVIFVGLDWVPSTILQGEARIHRIGQTRPITCYYLIALGTIDEIVRERVIERLDTFGAIVGDADTEMSTALRGGTEDEILASIVAAVLAA